MKINGKIDITGYLTVANIDEGECFIFQDENILYLRTDNGIVEMATGEYYSEYGYDDNKPVQRVQTELNIIKVYQ